MKPLIVARYAGKQHQEFSLSRESAASVLWAYRKYRQPMAWFYNRYELTIGNMTIIIRHL